MIKTAVFPGLIGHLLCWHCDRLITYTPAHRFHAEDVKDNVKLAQVFADLDPSRALRSLLLGVGAICLETAAYAAPAYWMLADQLLLI